MRIKNETITLMLFVLLSMFSVKSYGQAKEELVDIVVKTENRVLVQANNDGPRIVTDEKEAKATAAGGERSQCDPNYGQSSAATGHAKTSARKLNELGLEIELDITFFARGGHFRTCIDGNNPNNDLCNAGICVGLFPNDRWGEVNVSARASLEFRFPMTDASDYLIKISKTGSNDLLTTLKNAQGIELKYNEREGNYPVLHRISGGSYYLNLELAAVVSKNGQEKLTDHKFAAVRVQLIPLPILYGKALRGYIAGGVETLRHPYVGALRMDEKLHCSGTVIGPHTVLTAAHCIHHHTVAFDAGKVEFVFGKDSNHYEGKAHIPVGYDYPKGGDGHLNLKYVYTWNESEKEYVPVKDDIGLIYFKEKLPINPLALHKGDPPWEKIAGKIKLIFVGYGAKLDSTRSPAEEGKKREAPWHIDTPVKPYIFSFHDQGKSTCMGDSGGPALLPVGARYLVSGITSSGTGDCTAGINTRVDAYNNWLHERVR